uniref:DUF1353 domain-containing protein n=1 Tax=viral metagenome TaxID=1070528 RepID=A0A6M3LNT4_9ZZZZ
MIYYRSGYKYQLYADYQTPLVYVKTDYNIHTDFIVFNKPNMLTVRKGYAWDGASGPAIDTGTILRGALIHDACYQLLRESHLPKGQREMADKELRRICLEDGMWRIRAWWVYHAVRLGAGPHASPYNDREIFTAP